MATVVVMPRQGQSVESCVVGKWHKQKGDDVSVGDVLFTYETDKAVFEEEAKTDGVLLDIFFEEGDDVECLKNVCVIGEPGEDVDAFRPVAAESAASRPAVPVEEGVKEVVQTDVAPIRSDEIHISPRARALAHETGADVSRAVPTGANNRIMSHDIQKVVEQGHLATRAVRGEFSHAAGSGLGGRVTTFDLETSPAAACIPDAGFEEVKLSSVRRVIAKTMHASLADSAQLTLHSSFDATDILEFRKKLKAVQESAALPRITVTDIIIYAASRVLPKHKSMNAHFLGDRMALYRDAHIGVAVDTPRGLLVPTLFHANHLSLSEISNQAKTLFEKCRQGTIEPDASKGATFTVTNLGTLGIEMFTPVLNPPQTGILGLCSILERTKAGRTYPAMGLSLTFDHRALDGADAARFLKDLAVFLENFSVFLAL